MPAPSLRHILHARPIVHGIAPGRVQIIPRRVDRRAPRRQSPQPPPRELRASRCPTKPSPPGRVPSSRPRRFHPHVRNERARDAGRIGRVQAHRELSATRPGRRRPRRARAAPRFHLPPPGFSGDGTRGSEAQSPGEHVHVARRARRRRRRPDRLQHGRVAIVDTSRPARRAHAHRATRYPQQGVAVAHRGDLPQRHRRKSPAVLAKLLGRGSAVQDAGARPGAHAADVRDPPVDVRHGG